MSSLGERIRYARDQKGYLQSELAKLVGVKSSGVISNWEKDLNKPDAEKIVLLCEVLDVSASFLLDYYGKSSFEFTSSEEEHIKKYRVLDPIGQNHVDTILQWETERMKALSDSSDSKIITLMEVQSHRDPSLVLPYWESGVSAGNGIYQLNDTSSVMLTLWATKLTKQADFIIKVSGSSMEPDYHDGDRVLVDRKASVEMGEVGIFVKNGDTYIKEMGDGELISRNPEHPNIPVNDFDNVVCLGKVIGTLNDKMIVKE